MPIVNVRRPELLQQRTADVRHYLLLDELPIPFEGLRREIAVAIEPVAEIFGDGHPGGINSGAVIHLGKQTGELTLGILFRAAHGDKSGLALASDRLLL